MQSGNRKRPNVLDQLLMKALAVGAEAIELEYVSEGLEVSFISGNVGLGEVISDAQAADEIMDEIWKQGKLGRKQHGTIQWTNGGKQYVIRVEEREHFGESAYRLAFRKPRK